jgi:hypothetical protein
MSLKSIVTGAATGFLAGGPAGALAGGAAGAFGGGSGVQNSAAGTTAALDAETTKAFANQLESAKKTVAIQKVNLTVEEVKKAAQ